MNVIWKGISNAELEQAAKTRWEAPKRRHKTNILAEGQIRGPLQKLKAAINIDIQGNVIHRKPIDMISKGTAFFDFLRQAQENKVMSTPAVTEIMDTTNPIKELFDKLPATRITRHLW